MEKVLSIAVIGAGVAGSRCAQVLSAAGHAVRVWDKARGPGGRLATLGGLIGKNHHRLGAEQGREVMLVHTKIRATGTNSGPVPALWGQMRPACYPDTAALMQRNTPGYSAGAG